MSLPCGGLCLVPYPAVGPIIKDMKTICTWTAREWGRLHGAYEHSRGDAKVGSGASSWARILEQGLALDDLAG